MLCCSILIDNYTHIEYTLSMKAVFVETNLFEKLRPDYLDDTSYYQFQSVLMTPLSLALLFKALVVFVKYAGQPTVKEKGEEFGLFITGLISRKDSTF